MRATLKVKYLPPTNCKGTRLRVEDSKVYAYDERYIDFHLEAVRQFLGQDIEDYVTCCI